MNQVILALGEYACVETSPPTIPCGERPQARLENFGVSALSDTELIATILQGGAQRTEEALATASLLIAKAGSIHGLAGWQTADYRRCKGIGPAKAIRLVAVAEIGRRMIRDPSFTNSLCNHVDSILALLKPLTAGLQVEKFWVLCLNRRNRLLKLVQLTSGTANATLAHPREVYREALRYGASAIVCAHNHPSGDPSPSAPDMQITRMLRDASKAIDIAFLDHVICGSPERDPLGKGYYSFRAAGML